MLAIKTEINIKTDHIFQGLWSKNLVEWAGSSRRSAWSTAQDHSLLSNSCCVLLYGVLQFSDKKQYIKIWS